ncbi:MAG: glycine--tRNA ligase [Parcubacteria group bacterium 21-54-25]|nr:MAG: glycine--tRNA ligase [Parcubacteria group bacterium 21-54-25]HQU07516.1 glycine--tRNA ligase [Candidatus Paceibacterota bacterium]
MQDLMEKVVSLAKRRGFVFPGSEIYGGLAGVYDYGPFGVALKNNIKQLWWRMFVERRDDMYGVDAAILMNSKVWEASGHVAGFSDPLVECEKCRRRFRADHLTDPSACPECGSALSEPRQFNMMFKTHVGASEDEAASVYLRPETAGGIFANFKNVVDALHPKLPFGIAQIGKAFRNEIAPRDFIFRLRELEQMEVEYFVREGDWERAFEEWRVVMHEFATAVGLPERMVHELAVPTEDLAHYSTRTIDFEFDYPFGRKELWGLAYRTNFDLSTHEKGSGVDLKYMDEEMKTKIVPHVIEPSLGVDRTVLAALVAAYREDDLGGEKRVYLALSPKIAPVKAAVSPLLKNKPELVEHARQVYRTLKKDIPQIMWDDNGNIGKRYRRQDEIGTPFCITIDFDTLGETPKLKDTVTLRDRDSGEQERVPIAELFGRIRSVL